MQQQDSNQIAGSIMLCHPRMCVFGSTAVVLQGVVWLYSQRAVVVVDGADEAQLVRVEGGVLEAEEDLRISDMPSRQAGIQRRQQDGSEPLRELLLL
jgi:hypothetical protein